MYYDYIDTTVSINGSLNECVIFCDFKGYLFCFVLFFFKHARFQISSMRLLEGHIYYLQLRLNF